MYIYTSIDPSGAVPLSPFSSIYHSVFCLALYNAIIYHYSIIQPLKGTTHLPASTFVAATYPSANLQSINQSINQSPFAITPPPP